VGSSALMFQRVPQIPKLHGTPLAAVHVENSRVVVELDDENERRFRLVFSPYQALRVTTADCFSVPRGQRLEPWWVVQVLESSFLSELRATLKRVDTTATFMSQAKHFLIPAQDEYIEVVAWNVSIEASS